jgi:hypothetical protein
VNDRIVFFEEEHFFYLLEVEILKLLEISIFLAHGLSGIPKIWKEVLIEEVYEYHGGKKYFLSCRKINVRKIIFIIFLV